MSDATMLARGVADAVFSCLLSAERDPERETHWRTHADKLEAKFTNEHGRHYSYFIKTQPA